MTLWVPPPPPPLALRREGKPPPPGPGARPRPEVETTATPERAVVCVFCQRAITTDGARISAGGGHEHRFVNPAGFVFDVQCFRVAPGCDVVGPPTAEFSWFPGFTWQLAYCGGCASHLGWRFESRRLESRKGEFFGLVADRIACRKV